MKENNEERARARAGDRDERGLVRSSSLAPSYLSLATTRRALEISPERMATTSGYVYGHTQGAGRETVKVYVS